MRRTSNKVVRKASPISTSDLSARIATVLASGSEISREVAEEAAFHLSDWYADWERVLDILSDDEEPNLNAAKAVVIEFAAHAAAHIAAAHRILLGFPVKDVFRIGSVKGTGRGERKPGEGPNLTGKSSAGRAKKSNSRLKHNVSSARSPRNQRD